MVERPPAWRRPVVPCTVMVSVDPPRSGPCSHWAKPEDVAADAHLDINALDPELLDIALSIASEALFLKSGSIYSGTCEDTIRPVRRSGFAQIPEGYPFYRPPMAELVAGQWYNFGGDPTLLCDGDRKVIDLGQYPVTHASVKIDGAPLDPAAYRIDLWHLLRRVDGQLWPGPNNLDLADTEPGTWSVKIRYGQPPSQFAQTACAQLAAQLTKHAMPDQKCDLPLRATQVSQRGVTFSLADVMDILDRGKTGLYLVDLFLDTVNPNGLNRPARVLSPDIRGPMRLGS